MKEVLVYYDKKRESLFPKQQHYGFLRGKFIFVDDRRYLLLLSSSNSNLAEVTVEKYFVSLDKGKKEIEKQTISAARS